MARQPAPVHFFSFDLICFSFDSPYPFIYAHMEYPHSKSFKGSRSDVIDRTAIWTCDIILFPLIFFTHRHKGLYGP